MIPLSGEAYILMTTIFGGILIGFTYNLYKIFRGFFHPKKLATNIQDFLFWILITGVAFYMLFISNRADLRFYNFLGFLVGTGVYNIYLSKIITRALLMIIDTIKAFFIDLYKILAYPLQLGLCFIELPYKYCKKKTKPIYYKVRKSSFFTKKTQEDQED